MPAGGAGEAEWLANHWATPAIAAGGDQSPMVARGIGGSDFRLGSPAMAYPSYIDTTARWTSMRQIHCAIEHLHRGDWESAITLAGAGEGIAPETDKPHFRQKVNAVSDAIPEIEGEATNANDYIN
jgi:hypothetical protein